MLLLGLILVFLPRPARASPEPNPETIQAPVRVMEVSAAYAYLGLTNNAGAEYVVFDISRPELPRIVDQAEVGQTVSALHPAATGTFIATESAQREIFLRTREPDTLRKIITLPGEGKIVKLDQIGELLVVLSKADTGGDHTFLLDIQDPAKPKIQSGSPRSEARIAHKLRTPPQIAQIPPRKVARLWEQHPGDANYALVGLDTEKDSFRVHRVEPETLRFEDNNGDGMLELACIGDSNTVGSTNVWPSNWCHWVAEEILNSAFATTNYSANGARIDSLWPDQSGATLLANALEEKPDAIVFALGSNDLPYLRPGHLDEDIRVRIHQLEALVATARKNGAQSFVALLPPRFDQKEPSGARSRFNEAIRAHWEPHEILDFDSGFSSSDFGSDGLHFKGVGHAKRAVRAAEFLQKDSPEKQTP
ncbi:MAG: SGNH/GDSL hydrolase family protein [Candidatus Binatia bacterium]|nr:SGNH/GDSL hydrolase family protein [Candidatus Binatia bacterium]MDG2008154.1 SGNH/GDSL hydrolase family protein [Candidatus Binatia bacterium]